MKRNMFAAAIKKGLSVLPAVLMTFAFAVSVQAGAFDDFNDYQNPDGTYSYYFTQGVKVTMDKDWYQKTMVVPNDYGAGFYHKASYQEYQKKGYTGGWLFTIGASVNTDFRNLPHFEYIGFDEDEYMNYFAVLPTDYQAFAEDESIRAEYDALWAEVDEIISGIELIGGSASHGGDEGHHAEQGPYDESGLYTRVTFGDDFSYEIPSGWSSWKINDPDTLLASPGGSDLPPVIFARNAGGDMSAGEYAVQLRDSFYDTYRGGIVREPEFITYEPAGTDRKLAGFRGVYSVAGESREYTVLEYLEYIGDDLYHYSCCYVSGTEAEGDYEDETTYFEFCHAIDSMTVTE